jgi:hypothetical protein
MTALELDESLDRTAVERSREWLQIPCRNSAGLPSLAVAKAGPGRAPRGPHPPISFSQASSSSTVTPSSAAFRALEPGSAPTTR